MKTKMHGLFEDYRKMFKKIMHWDDDDCDPRYYAHGTHPVLGNEDDHYIYSASYALGEAGWHGWSGEALKNENDIFDKIEISYLYLLKSLAEAIGYEYSEEDSVWKYHLKDIDTDDILKLKRGEI